MNGWLARWVLSASGLFFAKPMREKRYVIMMDPFQIRYGNLLSGALVLPSIMMDILWVAATLLGLGELCFRWPVEPVSLTLLDADRRFLFSRSDRQRDPGAALQLLRLDLFSRGRRLHAARRPLLCGLHRRHPAGSDLLQSGEEHDILMELMWFGPFFPSLFNPSRCLPAVAVCPFPAAQPCLGQHCGDCLQQHLPGAVVGNAGPGRRVEMGGRLLDAGELHVLSLFEMLDLLQLKLEVSLVTS